MNTELAEYSICETEMYKLHAYKQRRENEITPIEMYTFLNLYRQYKSGVNILSCEMGRWNSKLSREKVKKRVK